MKKSVIIEYIPAKDSEWRLKKAVELLMSNKLSSSQEATRNLRKETKNA